MNATEENERMLRAASANGLAMATGLRERVGDLEAPVNLEPLGDSGRPLTGLARVSAIRRDMSAWFDAIGSADGT